MVSFGQVISTRGGSVPNVLFGRYPTLDAKTGPRDYQNQPALKPGLCPAPRWENSCGPGHVTGSLMDYSGTSGWLKIPQRILHGLEESTTVMFPKQET